MGTTLIECVKRAGEMGADCKDAIAYVKDTAQKYREEAKVIFDRIEQASVMTAEVRSVCEEMRKQIEHPATLHPVTLQRSHRPGATLSCRQRSPRHKTQRH